MLCNMFVEIYGPRVETWWHIGAVEMYLLPHMWRNKSFFETWINESLFFLINQYVVLLLEKDWDIITALLVLMCGRWDCLVTPHNTCTMYVQMYWSRRKVSCYLIATASCLFTIYIHTIGRVGLDNYTSCTPAMIFIDSHSSHKS